MLECNFTIGISSWLDFAEESFNLPLELLKEAKSRLQNITLKSFRQASGSTFGEPHNG